MRRLTCVLLLVVIAAGVAVASAESEAASTAPVTLKYWMPMHANTAQIVKNMGDTWFAQELSRRTGTTIEWLHPAGTTDDQIQQGFNLMLASGEIPDIVEYRWANVPGGPNSAITNGYIVALNTVFDRYAPNVRKYLKDNPEYDRMVKTDEGNYYVFPFLRADPKLVVTAGLILRKDWLDDLKLAVPTTLEEWTTVLRAFKSQKGAVVPLSARHGNLLNSFYSAVDLVYASHGFYVESGKIRYSLTDPRQKELLTVLNQWFTEGLLDPNFPSLDTKAETANIVGGRSGATYGSGGSGIGVWMASKAGDPTFNLTGAPFPKPRGAARGKFGVRSEVYGGANYGNAAISAKTPYVAQAAKLLDYAYGAEGSVLFNFGIEGKSYTLVSGEPVYTDWIMKNPEKLAITQAMSWYIRGHTNGPFVQDGRYIAQYYNLPQQQSAQAQWTANDFERYQLPPITPTPDESQEVSKLLSDMNTYKEEMIFKFIMGTEPLAKFDEFVATLKKLGADRVTAIYQAGYDRYLKR